MFDQRAVSVATGGLANGPNVVRGHHRDAVEKIITSGRIGTVDDRPSCAIPMLDHRAIGSQPDVIGGTNCPDIVVGRSWRRKAAFACFPTLGLGIISQSAARAE